MGVKDIIYGEQKILQHAEKLKAELEYCPDALMAIERFQKNETQITYNELINQLSRGGWIIAGGAMFRGSTSRGRYLTVNGMGFNDYGTCLCLINLVLLRDPLTPNTIPVIYDIPIEGRPAPYYSHIWEVRIPDMSGNGADVVLIDTQTKSRIESFMSYVEEESGLREEAERRQKQEKENANLIRAIKSENPTSADIVHIDTSIYENDVVVSLRDGTTLRFGVDVNSYGDKITLGINGVIVKEVSLPNFEEDF